jgi:glyoxylase-like metal-dependent hydrolase (beta-lactamase superfamily II)
MLGTQAPAFYRFKLGAMELTAISDGPLQVGDPSGVYAGISKEELGRVLADNFLPTDSFSPDQNALLVNTGDRLILFDTGMGNDKMFGPHTGRLQTNLRAAGIDPKDVDAVILTHAHPDHCWGLVTAGDALAFPNAQIYITQADLEFWTDEAKLSHNVIGPFVERTRKVLLPIRDRIQFVRNGQEIVPGVEALPAPGHTVGHTAYMITSQGRSLCNVGDIAHHHVLAVERPRLQFAFDSDAKQAAETRVRFFEMLAAQRIPMITYHFPWPGIGHVAKNGDAFRYVVTPPQMVL